MTLEDQRDQEYLGSCESYNAGSTVELFRHLTPAKISIVRSTVPILASAC
jgi:hypothetical protein